ncbi:hypothetical protein BKA93DRAFT_104554 [Sparassis latifolia]
MSDSNIANTSSNAEAGPTWPVPAASGAVEAQLSSTLIDEDKELRCMICKTEKNGRKLIVALDGTLNKFGSKNSNIVEIYTRMEKDSQQRSYYNGGIKYANTARSTIWKRTKLKLGSLFDTAFAWYMCRIEIVLGAYRWLADTYQPGDQIFMFGFSRGAYQVRVLAGMIEQVGLIYSGNGEHIPLYILFLVYFYNTDASPPVHELYKQADDSMANLFKETFSRREVKVHFLGIWGTVPSVGAFGGKKYHTGNYDHICQVRHALALDERRVKFNPEFFEPSTTAATRSYVSSKVGPSWNLLNGLERNGEREGAYTHLKEVWFSGCHSDVSVYSI